MTSWLCHKKQDGNIFYRKQGNNLSLIRTQPFSGIKEEKTFNTHPEDTYDGWNDSMWDLLIQKEKMIVNKVKKLYDIYQSSYVFPEWVKDPLELQNLNWADTIIYYNSKDDFLKVKKIATEREPVNIAMSGYYNEKKLQENFGYSKGGYKDSTPDCLMPNISIFCRTPVIFNNERIDTINVINLIGYAFDNKKQPDYLYFMKNGILNKDALKLAYAKVWVYAFIAAFQHRLKKIQVFGVGSGYFRPNCIGENEFLREYVDDAIIFASQIVPEYSKDIKVEREPDFFIPGSLFNLSKKEIDNTLFVNAWDPWSMVGNGNKGDRSLDGFYGRCTAMVPLCWPIINSEINYQSVDMKI